MAFNRKKAEDAAKYAARAGTRSFGSIIMLILKVIGTVLLVAITTGVMFACIFAFYVRTTIQSQIGITLEDYTQPETSFIYYNNSGGGPEEAEVWCEVLASKQRQPVEYEQIPQNMLDAAVAIEDKRFYEHDGVDWYRTIGAFYTMFFGSESDSSFGASTITQQLIKNLTDYDDVTVKRKIVEIFRALEVEKYYSKEEILTWYLNAIYMGQNSYGAQAAAQTYFGKDVSDLSLAECACIVGITNRPTRYDPYYSQEENKKRQETILEEMYNQGYITRDEYTAAVAETLNFVPKGAGDEENPDFVYTYYQETVIDDVVKAIQEEKGLSKEAAQTTVYQGGLHIYTCVEKSVQDAVDSIYTNLDEIPSASGSSQQFQSAITIQDPATGYIVAICGGVGQKVKNLVFNRATDAMRPPGSSIKPLSVYGPALDINRITVSSAYEDSPITISGKQWPKNDNGKWSHNTYNITTAVQRSINTIAVRVCQDIGTETSYYYLTEKLGLTTVLDRDENGNTDIDLAPMALGQLTNGATVRDMTSAYCAIANNGMYTQSKTFYLIKDSSGNNFLDNREAKSHIAFQETTAKTLTALLQNAVRSGTGTDARLSSGMAVAGKTGTAGDKKDRWFCGFTPYYTAAVWTGYDTPATITTSGNPAAKLWNKVMTLINGNLELDVITDFNTGITLSGKTDSAQEDDDEDDRVDESQAPTDTETPSSPSSEAPTGQVSQPPAPPSPSQDSSQPPDTSTEPDPTVTPPPQGLTPVTEEAQYYYTGEYMSRDGDDERRRKKTTKL